MQNLGLLWQNGSLIGMGILLFFVACGPTSEGKAPLVAPAPSCTPTPTSTQTVAPKDEAR